MGGARILISNYIGHVYGRLAVIDYAGVDARNRPLALCICDCGNIVITWMSGLKSGHVRSCGCYKKEQSLKAVTTHGLSKHKSLYKRWLNIKDRCLNPNNKRYSVYGGRGIMICAEWLSDFESFYNWSMMNGYSPKLTIDRRDVNGNYSPGNCRWITNKEQQNNRTDNSFITHNGITLTRQQWVDRTGIKYETLRFRYNKGWRGDRLFQPPLNSKSS